MSDLARARRADAELDDSGQAAARGAADVHRELERAAAPVLVDGLADVRERPVGGLSEVQRRAQLRQDREARDRILEEVAPALEA